MGLDYTCKKLRQYIQKRLYITIGRKHTMVLVLIIFVVLCGDGKVFGDS